MSDVVRQIINGSILTAEDALREHLLWSYGGFISKEDIEPGVCKKVPPKISKIDEEIEELRSEIVRFARLSREEVIHLMDAEYAVVDADNAARIAATNNGMARAESILATLLNLPKKSDVSGDFEDRINNLINSLRYAIEHRSLYRVNVDVVNKPSPDIWVAQKIGELSAKMVRLTNVRADEIRRCEERAGYSEKIAAVLEAVR